MDTVANKRIIEALKAKLRMNLEDGFIENPYSWANGVVSALSVVGIELFPETHTNTYWIEDLLDEISQIR